MTQDFELVYGNLREAMKFFGQTNEHGDVRQLRHGLAISAGIEYGVFNICMLDNGGAEPVEGLKEFAHYFQPRARRWSQRRAVRCSSCPPIPGSQPHRTPLGRPQAPPPQRPHCCGALRLRGHREGLHTLTRTG